MSKSLGSSRAIYAALVLATTAWTGSANAQAPPAQPLTIQKLKTLISSGVPATRILAAARNACISFRLTPAVEAELRAVRAELGVIEGLRNVCYRAVVATDVKPPVETPTRPTTPATTTTTTSRRPAPARTPATRPTTPPRSSASTVIRGQQMFGVIDASDPTLSGGGRYDEWTFAARAGERLAIDVRSSDFDVKVGVGTGAGASYSETASDDDSGEGLDARLIFTPASTGQYTLRVQPYSTTLGRYSVQITDAPAARTPQTRYASAGQQLTGAIEDVDAVLDEGQPYEHWFLSARAGERLNIAATSSEFDTHLTIGEMRGGTFTALASDDDSGEGTSSLISDWSAPSTGQYVIRVRPFGASGRGTYTLSVTSGGMTATTTPAPTGDYISVATPQECRALSSTTRQRPDQPVAGFYVLAPASGVMTLTTENDTPDPVMYVYSPTSSSTWSLLGNDDDSGEGLRPLLRANVTAGVNYLVCLWSYSDQTGTMRLRTRYDDAGVPTAPTPRTAGGAETYSLTRGIAASGTLSSTDSVHTDGSFIDRWVFTGGAGERVRIRMTGSGFRPYFALFQRNAGGGETFVDGSHDESGVAVLDVTLPQSGTYLLQANSGGAGAQTGSYTVIVEPLR